MTRSCIFSSGFSSSSDETKSSLMEGLLTPPNSSSIDPSHYYRILRIDSIEANNEAFTPSTRLFETSEEKSSSNEVPDLAGKDIYQRAFYRLSPFSEVENFSNVVVEERVRFKPDPEKGETSIKPVGPRTLILRDGNVEEGQIGNEFFEINIKESLSEDATHGGAGRDSDIEGIIATVLYLAANPKCIEGDVLEVGCGLGLAGLLGCIGVGALEATVHGDAEEKEDAEESADNTEYEDILTIPKSTKMTDELLSLTLSDQDTQALTLAAANVHVARVPTSQVSVEEIPWRTRAFLSHNTSPKPYHTIIASDLNYNFPEAKELARCVARRLEALSDWEGIKGDSKSPPKFVHVCPDRRDVNFLQRFLAKGYAMDVKSGYLKLEKLIFKFQVLPESEPESKLDDLELEVQDLKEVIYQSLTAIHDPMYAQGTGDYFFPMENGQYDNAGAQTYMEPESDGTKKW
ncbi:expressed unknown protein [Seminavis robusta]|uniref:S-adenosyl-L-methionine-dependent methyltransferase n=1 Tax=Seminavis robusta TaxID=568900 RepID=A0A9N8DAC0_9STRA|nr:expressed unknown protein [Seminavis robusta]|eukprot:Sro63_g035850.1 n/a (461) ;mRNA; f:74416-75901